MKTRTGKSLEYRAVIISERSILGGLFVFHSLRLRKTLIRPKQLVLDGNLFADKGH